MYVWMDPGKKGKKSVMINHDLQSIGERVTETETWITNKCALFYFGKLTLK